MFWLLEQQKGMNEDCSVVSIDRARGQKLILLIKKCSAHGTEATLQTFYYADTVLIPAKPTFKLQIMYAWIIADCNKSTKNAIQ